MQQATFWDGRAAKYDEDIRTHDSLYIGTMTRTTSLLTNSDVVLDLGCGSGEIGLDIARYVQRVHGIDVSTKMIELATQKAHDRSVSNVEFSQADAFDQRLAGRSFSAVTAFNVFHLVDDIHGVLARLYAVLEPGGLLVSQTPCVGERNWLVRALLRVAQWTGFAPSIRRRSLSWSHSCPVTVSRFSRAKSGMKRAPFNGWLRGRKTALKTTLAQARPNRARGPRDQETPKNESSNDGSVVSPIGVRGLPRRERSRNVRVVHEDPHWKRLSGCPSGTRMAARRIGPE